ncbi:MAG TPA: type II toxin-antitoxin system PemK/MazF family toxin [Opitutaceae bacterium]|nr:type II toxin-antitoxin system PemK/MazF family toxin [Opitutaceae bacterium]
MPIATFRPFDVIVVPFPFTDSAAVKRRPALVLSAQVFNDRAGHLVLAMITSRENRGWPLDVEIRDLPAAGLSHASIIRMKLFTLDERFVLRKAGVLATPDRAEVQRALHLLLSL